MPLPLPKNPTEAIGQRLLTDDTVLARSGGRVSPNAPTNEAGGPNRPYVYFFKVGGGGNSDLAGACGLQRFTFRVVVLAGTDREAEELAALVRVRLVGNRRADPPILPWRDLTAGVQGCFPADDNDADTDSDGEQLAGQSFNLYFCPQA